MLAQGTSSLLDVSERSLRFVHVDNGFEDLESPYRYLPSVVWNRDEVPGAERKRHGIGDPELLP